MVADSFDVSLWGVHEEMHLHDMELNKECEHGRARRTKVRTGGFTLRILASMRMTPLRSMRPIQWATLCSRTPNSCPGTAMPVGERSVGALRWMVSEPRKGVPKAGKGVPKAGKGVPRPGKEESVGGKEWGSGWSLTAAHSCGWPGDLENR